MGMTPGSRSFWMSVAIVGAFVGAFLALPTCATAQSEGQNSVYYYVSSSNPGQCCDGSAAFIDATPFGGSTKNFCGVLNGILSSTGFASGGVIDARGLPGATGTSMTCSISPWNGISSPPPAIILLPATGGTSPNPIVIDSAWILPSNTHLIGEGDNPASGTTVQGSTNYVTSTGAMIQFGNSTFCPSGCTGISIESLTLDGQGQSLNAISNQYAGESSFVDHVSLYRFIGTGLSVSNAGSSTYANNSGPYSNITFDTGSSSGTSSTVCAQILSLNGTRGIHGLRCNAGSRDATVAVLLDSSNNSIEDVTIASFYNGILIGSQANAHSNVLLNIVGDTNQGTVESPINVIQISSNHTVTDLSIMGVVNQGTGGGEYTIVDDETSTTLSDASVGVYALGEQRNGVYSRFTTSPSVVTWAVGSNYPRGTCAQGSIYSCTGSSSNCTKSLTPYALWACKSSGGWTGVE